MSYLPGNPHIADASTHAAEASEINTWSYEDRLIMATMANAEATMALAYEQRTANLIAFARLETTMESATAHFGDDELAIIAARLGL